MSFQLQSTHMRPSLLLVLCLVLAVPLNATRQPIHARHGMVVAMNAVLRGLRARRSAPPGARRSPPQYQHT
jgi:hypothetical protein